MYNWRTGLDWIISTAMVVLIFSKDHFVPGKKRTHTSKPFFGGGVGRKLSLDANY